MMAVSTDELFSRAMEMSKHIGENFLDLARTLRLLLDRDPGLYQRIVKTSDIDRRKAYYLVTISKTFDPLKVSRTRLQKIGWTKLEKISKHVTKENVDELLDLAEANTVKKLEALMKGEQPIANAHCVLMYFTPKQYKDIEEILLQNGGKRSGRGILNKEKALIRALSRIKGKQFDPEANEV